MKKVKVYVAGVGKSAPTLVQAVPFYKASNLDEIIGLRYDLCSLEPDDMKFVATFERQ
ncbi:MAG: hypothetical protein H3Z50_01620 [archaeon]|nr:hypothetical protein [archaeon]MCP8305700.1 hypothetical protein [archaeon]